MSESQMSDSKFAKFFFLMIGLLILLTLFLVILANINSREVMDKLGEEKRTDTDRLVAERVEPVGSLNIGEQTVQAEGSTDESAVSDTGDSPATDAGDTTSEPTTAASEATGDQVYAQACAMCHDAGVAGAPKFGDSDAWAERLEQDIEVIYGHAINGFQGNAGFMPAKGGNASLSDDAVRAAVDHLIEASQ